jgi:hypothetical protein
MIEAAVGAAVRGDVEVSSKRGKTMRSGIALSSLATTSLATIATLLLAGTTGAQAQPQALGNAASNVQGLALDLMSLERKGNILTVKWAVHNTGSEQQNYIANLYGRHVTTYVLDEENGTKYYVLTDKEEHSVATEHEYIGSDTHGISEYIKPGETLRFWMKLPAPPPEVKSVSVFFTDAEPLEGLAITEK